MPSTKQETSQISVSLFDSNGDAALPLMSIELPAMTITDPELIADLQRFPDNNARSQYAQSALLIGARAIRSASVQLDTQNLKDACQRLLADFQEKLSRRGEELTGQLSDALRGYLDPTTGLLTQRIQSLVSPDGELERVLKTHVGGDESVVARTLARQLGENSPVFKMLSPTESNGLLAQVTASMEKALAEQRSKILNEFSLDHSESALSRLHRDLTVRHGEITTGIQDKVDSIVKEFSFDQPTSAISRLVSSLNASNKAIADEFSLDNKHSAINRITAKLDTASAEIVSNLSLDNDQSALSRMKRTIDDLVTSNLEFHSEVHATLAALQIRKQAAKSSPTHGFTFEDSLGALIAAEAARVNDLFEDTTKSIGVIKHCKKGDFVTSLGAESMAPGSHIAWEAKDEQGWTVKKALVELEEARKNRQAQVGIFIFARSSAPTDLEPFARYGHDIIIVWDAEDPSTDIFVRAALSVARALVVKQTQSSASAS